MRLLLLLLLPLVLAAGSLLAQPAFAQGLLVPLSGHEEVPPISTPGNGELSLSLVAPGQVGFTLTYGGLKGSVLQAHLHFGQAGVDGGIVVFLCTNLGNGPAGTPLCPAQPATVSGQFGAAQTIGVPAQGFAAGDFAGLVDAAQNGTLYVNVHTMPFADGEIRGQLQ